VAKENFQTIDEYIQTFPNHVQAILQQIRLAIQKAAPKATEKISYGMPTFFLEGNLVHFAAFKNHIGFYPVPSGIEKFKKELSKYKGAKGSVQFPLDKPIPLGLISKIVKFRVQENRVTINKKLPKKVGGTESSQGFPKTSAPAQRALHNAGYTRLEQLSKISEADLLKLHGMGPKAVGILKQALKEKGLKFK
jgi:uncharacterized protein YdhG (YjbR/CyaY superfamily)